MVENTVKQLAEKLGMELSVLLEQLAKFGFNKKPEDALTNKEKEEFVSRLRGGTGEPSEPKKITLKRKRTSETEITDQTGRKRKVTVVRKQKRVYAEKKAEPEVAIEEPALIDDMPKNVELSSQEATTLEIGVKENNSIAKEAVTTTDASVESTINKAESIATVNEKLPAAVSASESTKEAEKALDKKKKANKKPITPKEESSNKAGVFKKSSKGGSIGSASTSASTWDVRKTAKITTAIPDDDDDVEVISRRARRFKKPVKIVEQNSNFAPMKYEVNIGEFITVASLAQQMALKVADVIKKLMQMGVMATINQLIDQDTALLIVSEFGHSAKTFRENALEEDLLAATASQINTLETRAPVVTIMGHVDHGKTSLLDYIRRTKVTSQEAGGITQHIGAYSVKTAKGNITFLDTPGHAAFSAMRARGATCTDIVVLVVASDDGVMPQTIEAIQHARAANVPVIVAVNKIDKPEADLDRVRTELSHHNIISEEWGGDNQFVYLSAKTGQGVDELLDSILIQAEVLELQASKNTLAKGVVIESRLDKGLGAVVTVLVQSGTLRKGDIILADTVYGRVRAMINAVGKHVELAGPSDPVEVLGLSAAPNAGEIVIAVADERKARDAAQERQIKKRQTKFAKQHSERMDDLFSNVGTGKASILNIVLKADVQGSAEALIESLQKLSTSEVRVKIIGSGVGGINESDVSLAMASKALIIGFNVRADAVAKRLAENENVNILYHSIIYNVIDYVKSALSGMLTPEVKENILGLAQVREVFRSSKLGAIAGCMVTEGVIKRNNPIRVLRNNVVIYEGELESLRRFKDDVNEVRNGMECGIGVKHYNDIKVGDQIEVFERVSVERNL